MDLVEGLDESVNSCSPGSGFTLDIPTWYKYLPCENGTPQIDNINDVWKIAAAILEIIVYIGGIAAVFFVIYGGIQFITSQGLPDKIAQARSTVINALAGLIIAILSVALVRFIMATFS